MIEKKSLIFVFLFMFLFSMNFISADTCEVVPASECIGGNTVLELYSNSNSHGQIYDSLNLDYVLCCDFAGTHDCDSTNKVLGLSATTNAHAEIPSLDNYATDVCYGDLSCIGTQEPSSHISEYPLTMVSLTEDTNAHIGAYADYDFKILCKRASVVEPPTTNGYWAGYDGLIEIEEINISENVLGTGYNYANTIRMIVNNLQDATGTGVIISIYEKDEGTGSNDDFIRNISTTIGAGGVVNNPWMPTRLDIDKSEPEAIYEFYFKTTILGATTSYRTKILHLGIIWNIGPGPNSECFWLAENNITSIERIIIPIEYIDGSGPRTGMSAPALDPDDGFYWITYYSDLVHTLVTDLTGSSGAHVYSQVYEGDVNIPIRTGNDALVGVLNSQTKKAIAPWTITLADLALAGNKNIYEFKYYVTRGGGIPLIGDFNPCPITLFIKILDGSDPTDLIGSWLNFAGDTTITTRTFDGGNLGGIASDLNTVQMNASGFGYVPETQKITLNIYEKNVGSEDDLIRIFGGEVNNNGNIIVPWTVAAADIWAAGNDQTIYDFYFTVNVNEVEITDSPENNLAMTITGTLPPEEDMFTNTVGIWMNDQGTTPKNYHPYQVDTQNVVSVYLTNINADIGTPIQVEIYEKDGWPNADDKIRNINDGDPILATVGSNGAAFVLWTMSAGDMSDAGNEGDADNPWEFYFNVVATNTGEEKEFDNEILLVEDGRGEVGDDCINIVFCSQINDPILCETCQVDIEFLDPEGNNICDDVDITCYCAWNISEGSCESYWSATGNPGGGSTVTLGSCSREENFNGETCDNNDFLTYSWTSIWTWGANNPSYSTKETCENANEVGDCVEYPESSGNWYYDPEKRSTTICIDGSKTIACPAQVQLPFGNWINWVFAIIIILVIYYLISVSKVGKGKKVKKKKKK